jgi:hypothetical protein
MADEPKLETRNVGYEPTESNANVKSNSKWCGPIWFLTTFLLILPLLRLSRALGAGLTVDGPGFTKSVTLHALAGTIAEPLIGIFKLNAEAWRPCFGRQELFPTDRHRRGCLLLNEFYHAETGQGMGASHPGWTGLVANLIDEWRR